MNDKVKEIAIETGYLITDQMHPMLEKFAELIIQECIDIVQDFEQVEYMPDVSGQIKKYFGIE